MIHICRAEPWAASRLYKTIRATLAKLFTPAIRCAHCRKRLSRDEPMYQINPTCSVYHDRCWAEMLSPGYA